MCLKSFHFCQMLILNETNLSKIINFPKGTRSVSSYGRCDGNRFSECDCLCTFWTWHKPQNQGSGARPIAKTSKALHRDSKRDGCAHKSTRNCKPSCVILKCNPSKFLVIKFSLYFATLVSNITFFDLISNTNIS